MSIYKLAETVELTIDIPQSEKKVAAQAVLYFEKLVRKLNSFSKHLDIIYDPFKEYQEDEERRRWYCLCNDYP